MPTAIVTREEMREILIRARRNGPPSKGTIAMLRKRGGVAVLDGRVARARVALAAAHERERTCLPCDLPQARREVFGAADSLAAAIESRDRMLPYLTSDEMGDP